jgi:hypothetical protein
MAKFLAQAVKYLPIAMSRLTSVFRSPRHKSLAFSHRLEWQFNCTVGYAMRTVTTHPSADSDLLARTAWISNVPPPEIGGDELMSGTELSALLFQELDGRSVSTCDRTWCIRVFSITEENGWRWLQLSLDGDPDYAVTVRANPTDSADQTLRALSAWLAAPSKTHHVVSVG